MGEARLDSLQRWMQTVITDPSGVAAADAGMGPAESITDVVLPSKSLTAEERIGIYAGMYFERLIGVLIEDFPALTSFVGFDALRPHLIAYLVAHPSSHYSLNQLGERLAAFLADEAIGLEQASFAAELTSLERGIQEVFDGRPSDTLSAEDLAAVPPDGWATLPLVLVPALRLFTFEYRLNDWYGEWRDSKTIAEPVRGVTHLALVRRNYKVWRFDLGIEEHVLLTALAEGQALGGALASATAQPGVDAGRLGAGLRDWFQRWSGQGFFAALPG